MFNCGIILGMSLILPILFAAASVVSNGTTRINAARARYDRKEGFALFSGGVSVVDPQYALHADRAIVYADGTNALRRIVALGNVAITNGTRRAYGTRASYYRKSGMVVLDAGENGPAEVRDEGPNGAQVLRGRKIKFWTGSQQAEVVEAEITAPSKGALDGAKGLLGR